MNIAIDSRAICSIIRIGVFTYTEKLLYGLQEIDKNNKYYLFFTSLRRKLSQMPGPEAQNFKKAIIRLPDGENPIANLILHKLALPHFLKNRKCDVVHVPVGYYLPSGNHVKKILTVHDLRTLNIEDGYFPQDIRSLYKSVRNADVCVAISEYTKQDLVGKFGINQKKIKVVYLGVDERFKPLDTKEQGLAQISQKYGINRKYFLSLGGTPRKNIYRLIKAFSQHKYCKTFQLVLSGIRTSRPWYGQINELIEELNLVDSIKLIGHIPDDELPLFYKNAECFVFPSLFEGFGIPILEAMKSGIPVITSNVSSLPEIGGKAALYVDPYNENDIAQAMVRIIEDGRLKQDLIKKGLQRASQFSWKKMTKEILKIYEE